MHTDLAAVVEAHGVTLKPKGANLVAPCPFHREKTASFTVSRAKRIFKCFGCGRGGDVFRFLELKVGLTLPQAVAYLEGHAPAVPGGPASTPAASASVGADTSPTDRPPQAVMNRVIAQWQKALAQAPRPQAYLKGRALWRPDLIRAFRIGYASGSLPRTLPGGATLRRQLTAMGILTKRSTEFFYLRIVIPIFDEAAPAKDSGGQRAHDSPGSTPVAYDGYPIGATEGDLLPAIDTIRAKLRSGDYEVTIPHFIEEMANDDLAFDDVESAVFEGRVRRRFTHDPRGTRYEVVGPTTDGRWIVVVCRIKTTGMLLLITTFLVEPDV